VKLVRHHFDFMAFAKNNAVRIIFLIDGNLKIFGKKV